MSKREEKLYKHFVSKGREDAKNKVQAIFDELCNVLESMGFTQDCSDLIAVKTFLHRNTEHESYSSALSLYNEMIKASISLRPMARYVVRESSSLISGKAVK